MRRALGRGLEALLPSSGPAGVPEPALAPLPAPPASAGPGRVAPVGGAAATAPAAAAAPPLAPAAPATVAVADITPNPEQPRRHFEEEALEALAASIRRHGLLQPLIVRRTAGGYELIAGERRWRAARRAGLSEVPVVLREAGEGPQRLELALIENVQREDLTPLEEAEAYRQLIEVHGLTQDEIAGQVGRSRPAIANALRLLGLPDAVKAQLESGELTAGHARAVLQLDGADVQVEFAREIAAERLPKSEAERRAASRRSAGAATATSRGNGRRPAVAGGDVHWKALADELTGALGTRVRLSPRAKGGTIEIDFYSLDQLDGLVARLRGGHPAPGTGVF